MEKILFSRCCNCAIIYNNICSKCNKETEPILFTKTKLYYNSIINNSLIHTWKI